MNINYNYNKRFNNEDYSDNIRISFNKINKWGFDKEFKSLDVEIYMEHQLKTVKTYFEQHGMNGNGIHLGNVVFPRNTYGSLFMEVEKRLLRMWHSSMIEEQVAAHLKNKGWDVVQSTELDYIMGVDIVGRNPEGNVFLIHVQSNGGRNWAKKSVSKAKTDYGAVYQRNWNLGSHVEFDYKPNTPLSLGQIDKWTQTPEKLKETMDELDYFQFIIDYRPNKGMWYPVR